MKSSAQGAEPRDEQLGFVPWNWDLPSPVCTGFGAFLSVTLWIVLLRDKLGSWCPPGCPLTQLLVSNNGGREVTQLSKPAPSCQVLPPQWVGPTEQRKCWGQHCWCPWVPTAGSSWHCACPRTFPGCPGGSTHPCSHPIPFAAPFVADSLKEGQLHKHLCRP